MPTARKMQRADEKIMKKMTKKLRSYSNEEKEILYLMFELATVPGYSTIFDCDLIKIADEIYEKTFDTEEMILKTIKKYIYDIRLRHFLEAKGAAVACSSTEKSIKNFLALTDCPAIN